MNLRPIIVEINRVRINSFFKQFDSPTPTLSNNFMLFLTFIVTLINELLFSFVPSRDIPLELLSSYLRSVTWCNRVLNNVLSKDVYSAVRRETSPLRRAMGYLYT